MRGISPARWAKLACVAGLLAGTATVSARKLADPDLPWHLAVGRAVVATRAFPSVDRFSYTFPGKPIPYEYLSDVLLYLTYRASPEFGPALLLACVVALLLALMRSRAKPDSGAVGWFVLAASLIALGPWLLLRPATLGFPILAAELLILDRHRRGGERRGLAALPPLQMLWANVHGFAVLGAALIGFYAAYCAVCRLTRGRSSLLPAEEGRDAAAAATAAAGAVAATCLSSFGPGIFLGPLKVAGHQRYITEWVPASLPLLLRGDPALLLLILLTAAALIWGRDRNGRRVPDLYVLGLAAASLLMTLLRFRLAPVFVIAAAPLLPERLEPLCRSWRSAPWLAAATGLLVPLGLAASAVAPPGSGFDPAWLPVAAGDYIEAHPLQGPVWNNLAFGGYLIWRFAPRIPVFVDGRTAHLYPNEFLEDAFEAEVSTRAFAALSAKYGFEWALVDARQTEPFGLSLVHDARWAMVYVDDRAAIYVKTDGPNRALALSGYRVLRHLTTGWDLLNAPPPLDDLQSDVDKALTQSPRSRHVQIWAAALALLKTRGAAFPPR